jgi:hypothetical protein
MQARSYAVRARPCRTATNSSIWRRAKARKRRIPSAQRPQLLFQGREQLLLQDLSESTEEMAYAAHVRLYRFAASPQTVFRSSVLLH